MNKTIVAVLFLLNSINASAQIDAQDRFFLLCYITQGKPMGHFLRPTPSHKGSCSFEYQCKENSFAPQSDTFNTLLKYWTTPIITYPLLDSLTYYDTVHFRIYPYDDDKTTSRYQVLDLSLLYDKVPFTTEEQRLVSLITILPFNSEASYLKDTTEIILNRVKGLSPPRSKLYTSTLYYLLYDYVYRKRRIPIVITYREDDTRYRYIMRTVDFDAELRKLQYR